MSSVTNSIFDVIGAFDKAEDILGPDRKWETINDYQEEFVALLSELRVYATQLMKDGLLETNISYLAAEINNWFSERGLDVQLEQDSEPSTFYVGAIYEQIVNWIDPGKVTEIVGQDGNTYRAVKMKYSLALHHSTNTTEIVAKIPTQEGDTVYMVMLDEVPEGPFGLLKKAHQIQDGLGDEHYSLTSLEFPMVDINNEPDTEWVIGMNTTVGNTPQEAKVAKAVQQTILKVNEIGALAKSGFAMTIEVYGTSLENPLIINRPFLFWIAREGFSLPLMAAWVDYSDWRNPGSLSE